MITHKIERTSGYSQKNYFVCFYYGSKPIVKYFMYINIMKSKQELLRQCYNYPYFQNQAMLIAYVKKYYDEIVQETLTLKLQDSL